VAALQNNMESGDRRQAYACDVTYGTNTEFGFDYLRDNMALSMEQLVQRSHFYCIVDEVDSILIDEARTRLIISGPGERAAKTYYDFARLAAGSSPANMPTTRWTRRADRGHHRGGLAKVESELGIDNIRESVGANWSTT